MTSAYPARVEAKLDEPLSRGLWLVKWLLALPHVIVLSVLWLAFVVLTIVAFLAILITGRYPRALFDFNVGVMRWTWRVNYYAYSALGTDRYPPFTLADVPDYPARLEVDYPERLHRGLVLVKWLLALPHLIIVTLFVGSGSVAAWQFGNNDYRVAFGGLITVLVIIAAVALLFTGSYPRPIFDFVLGLDRWTVRVGAYIALMTDHYPPFRLDPGGEEPAPPGDEPLTQPDGAAGPAPASGWTTGRIVSTVIGSLLLAVSTAPLIGGGTLLWADLTQRDGEGFLRTTVELRSGGHAVISDEVAIDAADVAAAWPALLGDVRITSETPGTFVGIAESADVAAYLRGVSHTILSDTSGNASSAVDLPGGPPAAAPIATDIWADSAEGPGAIAWPDERGTWTVVVMNADGTRPVDARVEFAATMPALRGLAIGGLVFGVLLVAAGGVMIALAVPRRPHQPASPPQTPAPESVDH